MLSKLLRSKSKSAFFSLIISNIILFVFTTTLGIITYYQAIGIIQKEANESCKATLEKTRDLMDTRLREVDNAINHIAANPKVRYFLKLHTSMSDEDYYYLYELGRNLPMYHLTNDFLFDLMIYINEQDIILSPINQVTKPEDFYNVSIKYENMMFKEWREKIFSIKKGSTYWPVNTVNITGTKENVITYVSSVIAPSNGTNRGVNAIALLKEKELSASIMNDYIKEGAWCYIIDSKGNIITQLNGEISDVIFDSKLFENTMSDTGYKSLEINKEKMTVVYTRSTNNGWTYVMAVPDRIISAKAQSIKNVFTVTISITLLLGIFISWFSAYKNSRPIKKIITSIQNAFAQDRNSSSGRNEYEFVENAIVRLVNDNESMNKYLTIQKTLFKASLTEKILQDGFGGSYDMPALLSHLGLKAQYSYFIVFVIHISIYDTQINFEALNKINSARLLVNNVCEDIIGDYGWIHTIGNDKIVAIIGNNSTDEITFFDFINEIAYFIVEKVKSDFGLNLYIGIGNRVVSLESISKSYQEAIQAVEFEMVQTFNGVCWYRNMKTTSNTYYFPIDIEMKIVNLVKAGEDKEIEAVMKTIHNQNFGNRELSVSMIKQLMYELRGTVLKIAEQLEFVEFDAHEYGVSELVEKFDSISSAEDKLNNITSILLKMANSVEKRKKSKNSKLKQDLLNYINENYMNSSLTMIEVAEKIGIASGYLAHFIKEQTGESFSSYLETIRMKKSREFLSQDLTVNEVMKRVGYNNQSTFFKAFKRVYGMTPTMLRSVEKNIM